MIRVNKIAKERYNLLNNSNKDFKSIFEIMFKDEKNILVETNDGFRIYKRTYEEIKYEVLNKAYSINKLYPDLKNEYIGISVDSSIEWIICFWAILASNNKPYLINHRHPKNLSNSILSSLNAKYVLGVKMDYDAILIDYFSLKYEAPKNYDFIFENEIALSTSATTLKEKIVFYNGEELSNLILNCKGILKNNKQIKKHYKDQLKLLVFLPLYHIFGLVAVYLWFSFFGRTLVFLNDYLPDTIIKTIKKHEVTHIFAVPLFWNTIEKEILKEVNKNNKEKKFEKGLNLSIKLQKLMPSLGMKLSRKLMREVNDNLFGKSIKFMISGGGYIKDSTLRLFNGLGYPLNNGYGMSEVGITSVELSKKITDRLKNSIGKPFDSIEYKIEDNELLIKGKSISHKYMIEKKLYTISNDEFFHSSDIAKLEDGRYYILGRKDDLFIGPNGENINPDLIEKQINLDDIINLSVINYNDELSLIIQVNEFKKNNDLININNNVINELNKINSSIRPTKYYFTFNPLCAPTAIKVSRQYVLNKLKLNEIKLFNIEDIRSIEEKYNPKTLEKVIEIIKAETNNDNINKDSNLFFDLGINSLEYFSIMSNINNEFNINLSFEDSLTTPLNITLKIEELI